MRTFTRTLTPLLLCFFAGTAAALAQGDELAGKNWHIRNKVAKDNLYMSASKKDFLSLAASRSPYEAFSVQEGQNGTVLLYNEAAGKYVGNVPLDEHGDVPLVNDKSEAGEYTATKHALSDGSYTWTLFNEHPSITDGRTSLSGGVDRYGAGYVERYGETASVDGGHWVFTEITQEPSQFVTDLSQIKPGKFYQIISSNAKLANTHLSSRSVYADKEGNLTRTTDGLTRAFPIERTNGSEVVPTLWKFEQMNDTSFRIRNANTGLCLGQIKDEENVEMLPLDEEPIAGIYTLTYDDAFGGWTMKCEKKWLGALENGTQANWDGTRDGESGRYWKILPVTAVPVRINAVAKWASLTLPFDVQLPQGLTAYYASETKGNVLILTAIESEILPAYTPVFLAPDEDVTEDPYSLAITGENAASPTIRNMFKGTTAGRSGFAERENYTLGTDGTKGVLLYNEASSKNVAPNKAYLLVSDFTDNTANAPARVSMQIGAGQPAGIGSVQASTAGQAEEYYDLTGRRVLNPSNGVFVTKDGQKVFIR